MKTRGLSTPSLGITRGYPLALSTRHQELSTPSLGITSAKFIATINSNIINFQLPLSGSLSNPNMGTDKVSEIVTFNSLSRDHGITSWVEAFEWARDVIIFQLPLSGSPSPIPGFSGSPRLSAAAPLRTNDF